MLKISVITCTYNAALTIERTLRSVAAQTYPYVEHIIIDGLSSDSTLNILQKYKQAASHHEIILSSEKDDGLYYAMNKGIAMATGDYILFLNAGDTFPSPHTLSLVLSQVNTDNTLPGVLFGHTDIVDNNGQFLRHRRLAPRETLTWRDFRHGMLVCHQAFYALTSIAHATPFDTHYRYSADFDWCIRIMKKTDEEHRALKNLHQVVVDYLAEGLTTTHHKASLRERFLIMSHYYGVVNTCLLHLWFILRAIFRR